MITTRNPATWTDCLERWHASVPMSSPAVEARQARRMIQSARPGRVFGVRRDHVTGHGTVVYVEDVQVGGFVCKECHGPSPRGVGYSALGESAAMASLFITACQCGYSILPTA